MSSGVFPFVLGCWSQTIHKQNFDVSALAYCSTAGHNADGFVFCITGNYMDA